MSNKVSTRSVRLMDDVFLKIKYVGKTTGRSASKQIEQILLSFLADYEKEHGTIHLDDSE